MPKEQNLDAAVRPPKKRREPRFPEKTKSAKGLPKQTIPKRPEQLIPTASW